MENLIKFDIKDDEIVIKISEEATYDEIIEELNKNIKELKELYKTGKKSIYVTGKILTNEEIKEIEEIITNEIELPIEFSRTNTLGLHVIKKAFAKQINISETKFHKGSLRAGKKIEFEGSVVILGDINGGAEVIAGENIVVLGILRGLAHAGAKGNKKATISTNGIDCPQLELQI